MQYPRHVQMKTAAPAKPQVPKATTQQAPVAAAPNPAAERMAQTVIREIQSMRGLINEQLSGLVFGDMQRREPDKLRMMSMLLAGGFSPALSRKFLEKAPTEGGLSGMRAWIKKALDKNLVTSAADEIVAKGGVYALLGPTGVGKTTTTAKLAARCVVRHGAEKLALLTTDNYRVGAHEHLRIYGRILGVSVHAVRDSADLEGALADLRGKHMVLVDTVGMSQKDQNVAEQVAMFSGHGGSVKRLLLLNATCQGDTLEDVVRAYGARGLAGCIITKADEAASLGAVLDTVIRHRLPVHYVANGQRVPEDIHPVNREYLLHRAIGVPRDNAVREYTEQDIPAAMFGAEAAF
jgi:flagellar biosynthesis protein FlhF